MFPHRAPQWLRRGSVSDCRAGPDASARESVSRPWCGRQGFQRTGCASSSDLQHIALARDRHRIEARAQAWPIETIAVVDAEHRGVVSAHDDVALEGMEQTGLEIER